MGLGQTEGQAGEGFSGLAGVEGTTGAAPGGEGEQSNTGQQTTGAAPAAGTTAAPAGDGSATPGEEVSFFDPSTVTEELMPAYKQMQAAFTKKMQGFGDQQIAIDAYNAFQANPMGMLKQLATQYGYNLVTGQNPNASGEGEGEAWEPQSWDEVMKKAEENVMQRLHPELKSIRQKEMERTMDSISPDWRVYEDPMMKNLQNHPSLVNDPEALYRMSVPPEVMESRATQAALKKLQDKGNAAQLSGGSMTTRTQTASPEGIHTFADAIKFAESELASKGVRP